MRQQKGKLMKRIAENASIKNVLPQRREEIKRCILRALVSLWLSKNYKFRQTKKVAFQPPFIFCKNYFNDAIDVAFPFLFLYHMP